MIPSTCTYLSEIKDSHQSVGYSLVRIDFDEYHWLSNTGIMNVTLHMSHIYIYIYVRLKLLVRG